MNAMFHRGLLAAAVSLSWAATALAGGQSVAVEVAKDGGSLLVHTYRCGQPSAINLLGVADGVVNGAPRRVELKLTPTAEPGVFSVARQWPAEGNWVLTFTNNGGVFVNAMVELRPGPALQIASQESTLQKFKPEQLQAALKGVASR